MICSSLLGFTVAMNPHGLVVEPVEAEPTVPEPPAIFELRARGVYLPEEA